MTSSSFGFKKGFLLSSKPKSSRKKKPKRIATKESLLHLEVEAPRDASLLIDLGGKTIDESSNPGSTPLIQVLLEENDTFKQQNAPLVQSPAPCPVDSATIAELSLDQTSLSKTLTDEDSARKHDFENWNRHLSETLHRMRGRRKGREVARAFVQALSVQQQNWTWDFIWQQGQSVDKRCQIGVALTLQNVDVFWEQLELILENVVATHQGKRWMLVCDILEGVLESNPPTKVLVRLIQRTMRNLALLTDSPVRTVLAQRAAAVSLQLVAATASARDDEDAMSIRQALWQSVDDFRAVVERQERWLWSNASNETEKGARSRCRAAAVRDWKVLLLDCTNEEDLHRTFKNADELPLEYQWQTAQCKATLDNVLDALADARKSKHDTVHDTARSVAAWLGQTRRREIEGDSILRKQLVDSLVDLLGRSTHHPAIVALLLSSLELLWTDSSFIQSLEKTQGTAYMEALAQVLKSPGSHLLSPTNERVAADLTVQLVQSQGASWLEQDVLRTLTSDKHRIDLLVALVAAKTDIRDAAMVLLEETLADADDKVSAVELLKRHTKAIASDLDIVGVLVRILFQMKQSPHPPEVEQIVALLVDLLESCDRDAAVHRLAAELRAYPHDRVIDHICQKVGDQWRAVLLSSGVTSSLGDVLVSIAKAMISNPSCVTTLSLFGSVAGDGSDLQPLIRTSSREYILLATEQVVTMVVLLFDQLEQLDSHDVFGRLAPLLLLRRLPCVYYRTVFFSNDDPPVSLYKILTNLANHLLLRLDAGPYTSSSGSDFTAEERRLAAEIAGRSLAMSVSPGQDDMGCSCYRLVCFPLFSRFCQTLAENGAVSDSAQKLASLRSTRAALFAACTLVAGAETRENACDLLQIASFGLGVLSFDADTLQDDQVCDGLIQLQTGCIEFFAVCIEKYFRTRREAPIEPGNTRSLHSIVLCISLQIVNLAKSGRIDATKIPLWSAHTSLGVATRVCLWNSILLVSRRCDVNDLDAFAEWALPTILSWGCSMATEHPLVTAAAMETVFVTVTRSKSLHSLDTKALYQWVLRSERSDDKAQEGHSYAIRTLRLSSMKLLLVTLSIEASTEDSVIGLDTKEANGLLHRISAIDCHKDKELGRLQAHVLSILGPIVHST